MSLQSSSIMAECADTAVAPSRLHVAIAYWDPYTAGGVQSQVAGRLNALGSLDGPVRYTLFTKQRPPGNSPWPHIRTVQFSGWDRGSIAISEYTASRQLVRRLEEIHRDDPFDLVELHASGFGPAVTHWALGERIPCLYVSHALLSCAKAPSGMRWDARQYYAWTNRRTAKECTRILAVSQAIKNQWLEQGVSDERVEVQHTAIDPCDSGPGTRRQENEALQLLFVGRTSPDKGLDVLIDAVERCTSLERLNMQLTVVGAISTDHPLVQSVVRRRLPVTFAGAKPNAIARSMMAQADAVVVPSRYEPCGVVAMEALQAGVLVVASRVGGLAELISDRETGFLVPPGDAGALAAVLCRIVRNRAEWADVREAARLSSRRFLWSERGPQILDLYRRLTDRGA